MRGLSPAIECDVEGPPLLFTFDTGASSTELSVRCYELFRQRAGSWKTHRHERASAGSSIQQNERIQRRVMMKVGTSTVTLKVSVVPVPTKAGLDVLFGNLGQDFVEAFESISLNFSTMTFSLVRRAAPITSPRAGHDLTRLAGRQLSGMIVSEALGDW